MENFTDEDVKDFADKLFDVGNKETAGHMIEPENIDEEKVKSFKRWVEKQRKDSWFWFIVYNGWVYEKVYLDELSN